MVVTVITGNAKVVTFTYTSCKLLATVYSLKFQANVTEIQPDPALTFWFQTFLSASVD